MKNFEIWDTILYKDNSKRFDLIWNERSWIILHISDRIVTVRTSKWQRKKIYTEDCIELIRKWRNIRDIMELDKLEIKLFWKIIS